MVGRSHADRQVPVAPPQAFHEPILVQEVLTHLISPDTTFVIDATLGLGGHAEAILQAQPRLRLQGIDRDPGALKLAKQRLRPFADRLTLTHGSFADLPTLAPAPADAILMDLGISSWQLAERGFSFQQDAPLDMRMNPDDEVTAAELVNGLPERELADLLYRYGEEHRSRRIAKAIVRARPLQSTTDLADVIAQAVGRRGRLHPATKSFQALRIAVNDEFGALERGLAAAEQQLQPGGKLAVISFHSLEDRIVKRFIQQAETLTKVNKKVVRPDREEIAHNSRARSAKLRIAEKLVGS